MDTKHKYLHTAFQYKEESPDRFKFAFLEHKENHKNSAEILTDCSKTDNGTAYAIVNNNNTIAKEIGNINLIYSAELYAIMKAMIVADNCQERNITIYSDSQKFNARFNQIHK